MKSPKLRISKHLFKMKRFLYLILFLVSTYTYADVRVNPQIKKGPVKMMNGMNNGPWKSGSDQVRDYFEYYKACRIPFARTHDASFCAAYGGEHTVDISAIFPDFSKDVDDPDSYDFTETDIYLYNIHAAGTGIFFRLGQRIEHNYKKYNILPPKDYKKWAKICEHIIRHYNEGWANGVKGDNIIYWEIWNEPDLDWEGDAWKTNPRTWGGSMEEFFKFYEIAAKHLKKCFPNLKIGGPALCFQEKWADAFLQYMSEHKVQLDFFSYHCYTNEPSEMTNRVDVMHKLLVKHGYNNTEAILNEWNYNNGWTDTYPNSVLVMNNIKGAAYVAACLIACQDHPVDMLMYYDARPSTVFNGLFDFYTLTPKETYYTFYAWAKLRDLGQEVEVVTNEKDVYATAATNESGKTAIFMARYNEDNNVIAPKKVKVHVEGISSSNEIIGHLTDFAHMYTEIPLSLDEEGNIAVPMEPESFLMIEIR